MFSFSLWLPGFQPEVNIELEPSMLAHSLCSGSPGWFPLTLKQPESDSGHLHSKQGPVPYYALLSNWMEIMFIFCLKFLGCEELSEPHDIQAKQFLKTEILL